MIKFFNNIIIHYLLYDDGSVATESLSLSLSYGLNDHPIEGCFIGEFPF